MSAISLRQIRILAGKEFWDRIRNRWVLAVALVFTAFAFVITYFGSAQQGSIGFRSIEVTIASLVSLVIYLIPLIALILGFDAVVGEREKGSLDLLLSMPITRVELILGKYFGLSAALAFSTIAGFGVIGLLLSFQVSLSALFHYAGFMLTTLLLGMSFLSIAILLSVWATDRTRASGMAIGTWFFFVLVFDLIFLGILIMGDGGQEGFSALVPYILLLNPADVFRVLNIFSMNEVQALYGLATVFPEHLSNPLFLLLVMLGWMFIPLWFAIRRFQR